MGTIQIDGSTPKLTIGNATAEDATILFDGNAQDFYIALDDSADDLIIGLGSTVGTTPAISINEDRDVTISDGAIDFDIASHDTSNGLKLGGTLVTATAAELNIMDGVTATAAEINLIDGGTARGTTAIADGDGVLINDAGTMRQTTVETLKTYIGGFDVSSITGATALAAQPASTDELVINDGGALKRLDFSHIYGTPAFYVNPSGNQAISNTTNTLVEWGDEVLDTDGCFASHVFTPVIPGWYYFSANFLASFGDAEGEQCRIELWKNGSVKVRERALHSYHLASGASFHVEDIILMDSNDYVGAYAYHETGSTKSITSNVNYSYFFGYRLAGLPTS